MAGFAKSTPTNHGKGRTPAPVARPAHRALTATAPPTNRCGYRKDLNRMPIKPLELPLEVAHTFARDMRAFFRAKTQLEQDEIASRQLHTLQAFQHPRDKKLRLADVKKMFLEMRDMK